MLNTFIRNMLQCKNIDIIDTTTKVILKNKNNFTGELFGSIYAIAVKFINDDEKNNFVKEAQKKGTNNSEKLKGIDDNLYLLYIGKDKYLGVRVYEHLASHKGKGTLQLNTYDSLRGKEIFISIFTVKNYSKAEATLLKLCPNFLKTKKS